MYNVDAHRLGIDQPTLFFFFLNFELFDKSWFAIWDGYGNLQVTSNKFCTYTLPENQNRDTGGFCTRQDMLMPSTFVIVESHTSLQSLALRFRSLDALTEQTGMPQETPREGDILL